MHSCLLLLHHLCHLLEGWGRHKWIGLSSPLARLIHVHVPVAPFHTSVKAKIIKLKHLQIHVYQICRVSLNIPTRYIISIRVQMLHINKMFVLHIKHIQWSLSWAADWTAHKNVYVETGAGSGTLLNASLSLSIKNLNFWLLRPLYTSPRRKVWRTPNTMANCLGYSKSKT